jgi:hypothetical protein
MPSSPPPEPQIPPDVVRYLKGATAQSRQFDFLIGNWDVVATRGACPSLACSVGGTARSSKDSNLDTHVKQGNQ